MSNTLARSHAGRAPALSAGVGAGYIRTKATLDRLLACLLVVLLSPVLALIGLAVRLDSPGPVLFRQTRVGLHNQPFTCLKFRSMRWEPAPRDAIQQTRRDDDRITAVGRFLRRTSLDELPQLFNVLRGEMSLVGPRPHAPTMRTEGKLCEEIAAEYNLRHLVKPGITGLAQVRGCRGATETIAQLHQRLDHDLEYVQSACLTLDLKILLLTPVCVLSGRNAF
jgi:lipopolysaccharide/colanic/teichoic acid biosynthesis glycosyltransferase